MKLLLFSCDMRQQSKFIKRIDWIVMMMMVKQISQPAAAAAVAAITTKKNRYHF